MSENNNKEEVKQEGEDKQPKIPEGFRWVEPDEVLPPGYETRVDLTAEKTMTNAPKKSTEAAQKFDPPKVLEVVIDPAQEQKEAPTKFSFSSPKVIQQSQVQPTKADLSKQQSLAADKGLTDKEKLEKLDAAIAHDEGAGKKPEDYTYDDYKESAEMYLEGWEGILQFAALLINPKGASSAYVFAKEKKERLILQGTKVLRKHPKWVAPIEALFIGNVVPASARIIIKARGDRKEYMEMKRKQEEEKTPIEINKGGPDKGLPKSRGPGRPSKKG